MTNDKRNVLLASDEPKPMGDTIFEYARPLFQHLPQNHTFAELRAIFVFAAVVWNVGLLNDMPDAIAYLARKVPRRLRLPPPQGAAVIRRMLTRKQECFRGDARAALDVQVVREGPKFRVSAIGVAPDEQPGGETLQAPRRFRSANARIAATSSDASTAPGTRCAYCDKSFANSATR